MLRTRPFVGSLTFRLLALVTAPILALFVLAGQRIQDEREHHDHAEAFVQVIELRRDIVRVYGPKNVERIAMEGVARIDELGLPRPIVVAATGFDFEQLEVDNHAQYESTLDQLGERWGSLPLDGSTLGRRLGEARARIDGLRDDLDHRVARPTAIAGAFDELDELLGQALDLDAVLDGHHTDEAATVTVQENDDHARLRALAQVVDSAGGRGATLLHAILYDDPDGVYTAVRADGRHTALAENYMTLLEPADRPAFEAVRQQLGPLEPATLDEISAFDSSTFDRDIISDAVQLLDVNRTYLIELDRYADDVHVRMADDARDAVAQTDADLQQIWIMLFAIGGITLLLLVLGAAATLRPLRRLTRRAESISAGNIDAAPLRITGANDVRALTRTTNEMTALLGEVESEIRRLADGDFEDGYEVDLPGAIGETLQSSMNRLHAITQRLQRSEQLASAIVAGAADAIWTVDEAGAIVSANAASERLTGVATDDQVGVPIGRFLTATWGEATLLAAAGEEWPVLVATSTIESGDDTVTIVIAHDISARLDFEQQLALQARRDPLTGLPNRLAVLERIDELLAHATPAAVLYIDLDGFKSVNDLRGHGAGDEVLSEVAKRLRQNVVVTDLVGRLGGDEFIVVTTTLLSPDDVSDLGSRLIGTVEQPFSSEGLINLSASIGVVTLADQRDAEIVLTEADSALYQAKHRGKGRLEVFDRALQAAVAQQTELEMALRRAIPKGELVLHLQPIIDLRTNRIDGAEALVRWARPGHGLVPPNDFIPLAERSSLIIDLDRWVIERCCERLADWRDRRDGDAPVRLAVNISGRHLMEGNLVADVASALGRTGADPAMLEIELTETHLLGDLERAVASLGALRDRGVRVSIDDFGTGYSAMNYLRQLPIDAIKIDRSFVVAATNSAADASVIDAVMAIGRSHGLEVIAEGIETPEHLEFVRLRGCHRAQGFLIARPIPADEAEPMILGHADLSIG